MELAYSLHQYEKLIDTGACMHMILVYSIFGMKTVLNQSTVCTVYVLLSLAFPTRGHLPTFILHFIDDTYSFFLLLFFIFWLQEFNSGESFDGGSGGEQELSTDNNQIEYKFKK